MASSAQHEWLTEHAQAVIDLCAAFGAHDVGVVGSVARNEAKPESDIDFFVNDFTPDPPDLPPGFPFDQRARARADALVDALKELCPFKVDVRGIPGWLLGEAHEASMRRDFVPLTTFMST